MPEWQATEYARESSLQKVLADEQLSRLTLRGDERVLDVGCGDGKITFEIAARVPRGSVLGVDPSRDMIAFATKQFAAPVQPNLRFEVADARSLPFRNEFDLAVSFNALHWVPEQEVALRSIHATLKSGGRAILRMVPQGERKSLEDVIEEIRQSPRWTSHFSGVCKPFAHFTLDEYRALAERAGFRVVRLEMQDGGWDFKTRDGFVAFARATFVEWTQHLPESDRDAFINDVLDRYSSVASKPNVFEFYQMEAELLAGDHAA